MSNVDINALLADLRDNPADNVSATGNVLETVFNHLTAAPLDPTGRSHWFCSQAPASIVAAASFLIRLYGFNGEAVERWKAEFRKCISNCCYCVQKLEEIKMSSRSTYFGAYNDDVLRKFFEAFEKWELQLVLEDLKTAGFPSDNILLLAGKTLSDVSPVLLYRTLSNWTVFSDPRIQDIIHTCPPTRTESAWPPRSPPPGIFVLLMDQSQALREWSRSQCPISELVMMTPEIYTDSYASALLTIANEVQSPNQSLGATSRSRDPPVIWNAFHTILRLAPVEELSSTRMNSIDLRHIVTGHLLDTDSHFSDVLRSFLLLLKRLSHNFWPKSDPDYPTRVFDSVKDNPTFSTVLEDLHISGERLWALSWIPEFLHTLQGEAVYGQVLAKVLNFLFEETQPGHLENVRPMTVNCALQIVTSVFRKCQTEPEFPHTDAFLSALDTHSTTIAAVAYRRDHDSEPWKAARSTAQTVTRTLLSADVQKILVAISNSCKSLSQIKKGEYADQIPAFSVRKQLWTAVYSNIDSKDVSSIGVIINIVAKVGYLTAFIKEPFKGIEKAWATEPGKIAGDKVIDLINDAVDCVQNGLLDLVSRFANYSSASSALELLGQTNVGKSTILLLLSPVPSFQTAAQTLIGLAFDVDIRADCVREMFVNMPDATFDGAIEFLSQFNVYAAQIPEACLMSRSLVRCFNDVLEVLCTPPDGLLLREAFLRPKDIKGPSSRLLEFWKVLTTALTSIFKRTVAWAAFYKPKEMVEWMRDAVILGRDLIQRWRVIETATNGQTQGNPSKHHSGVRAKMIGCFQDMLPELSKWLRLTDEELLYQSFAILQNLLEVFKETNIKPHEAALARLSKYIADARADGKAKSRLDPSSLAKLEDAMAAFDEGSDDEVQIVGHIKVPKKEKAPPVKAKAPKEERASKPDTSVKKDKGRTQQEAPVRKGYIQNVSRPAQTTLTDAARRASFKKMLSDADKAKLEQPAKFPTFQRSSASTASVASSSKAPPPAKRRKGEYKNEAHAAESSSEDSSGGSSDDEDNERASDGLAAFIQQLDKAPKVRKQERRQIKTLDVQTSKSAIQERLNNRSKATQYSASLRLRPDISSLHKTILSWKYDHDGPVPPGENLQLSQVPAEFSDYSHYRQVFGPLLLLECWSQILRSKEEVPDSYLCKISSKEYVSEWLDLDLSITDNPPREWELAPETDIILLTSSDGLRKIMAKTLLHRKNPMASIIRARCYVPGGNDLGLQQGTDWRVSKIYSLSTINREYGALVSLPYLNCFNHIIYSRLAKVPSIDSGEIEQTMANLKVNKPQATAILGAMKTEGFVLIQGPPGTGKTSTICGLVSRFISRRPTPINVPEKQENPPKAKILICAPSNAAIDEIAGRLVNGTKKMNVVRTGSEFQIGASVKSASLDQLVKDKIQAKTGMHGISLEDTNKEIKALLMEMDSLKHLREDKLKELTNFQDTMARRSVLEQETQRLRMRRQELGGRLTALRDKVKSDNRSLDGLRRQMRREVLLEADVVCSTLSGAGHEALVDQDFEMVIIDEAAQSIELSSLIPLKFNCKRCVMVGDPQQLPPTVISQEATRRRYDQSLFLRLFKTNPNSVYLLSIQYRMHPDISRFPSQAFYQGRIEDGPNMSELTSRPWHTQPMFGTYKFFNVPGVEEPGSYNSIKNVAECQIAKAIYSRLSKEFQIVGSGRRIGIVSMYRAQIQELRRQFFQAFGESILDTVDFNTVDGFQGQEKDIIILSCVRAGPGLRSIGFLSDVRRLNVAITRAKSSLFILGNAPTLERSDETWKNVVTDARDRGRLVTVDTNFFAQAASTIKGVTSLSPVKKVTPVEKKPRIAPPAAGPSQAPLDLATPQALKNSMSKRPPVNLAPSTTPMDLATPQALKNVSRKPSVNLAPSATPVQHVQRQGVPGAPEPPRPVAGSKRPAEDSETRPGPSNQSAHSGRPPPPKRPKPPQPSLFIPKKPPRK